MQTKLSRRSFLAVAGAVASPAIVRPKTPDVINIAYFTSPRPALVAKGLGWFQDGAKARLNWNDVGGGAEINLAVAAGNVDIAIGISSLQAAAGISQGIPYKLVGVEANTGPAEELTVRHTANIRKPADLKGKRIAVPFGSSSHFRLLGYLRAHTLAATDVTLVDLKPDAMVAAWGRGDIDAGYVWSPARGKLLAAGGDIFDTAHDLDTAGIIVADLIVVRGVFLEQYPDAVSGLLRAYGRALDLWKSKPAEAAENVAKQTGISTDAAQAEMSDCDFPTLKAQTSQAWLGDHGKLAPALKRTADFMVDQRVLRSAAAQPVFDKAIDLGPLSKAMA